MRSSAATGIGVSTALQIGLWLIVLVLAFVMQVVPFLLVLTLFNLAIDITSGAALVIIPVAAFGMLFVACWIATRRANRLPPRQQPQRGPTYRADYRGRDANRDAKNVHQRLVSHLSRWRLYRH